MADFSNIPTGLKVPTQIPLDSKRFALNEAELSYLGVDNNLAFTYHDQLEVLCLTEKKIYQWREVQSGEENTGLVPLDFTYPVGLFDVYGINYSGKKYNFFLKEYVTSDMIVEPKDIVSPNDSVTINETSTQIQLTVPIPTGAETKIINGLQTTVTGTGTTLDPYKIDGKLYQAGDNISITGSGTTLSPYIISVNNNDGNIGWLKGDTKEVVCDNTYIGNNFTISGLGINERVGWAILNGNTHIIEDEEITLPNDNGRVVIAYGSSFSTPGTTDGNSEHTLSINELPKRDIRDTSVGSSFTADVLNTNGVVTDSTPDPNPISLMQPYVVRLRIMKL